LIHSIITPNESTNRLVDSLVSQAQQFTLCQLASLIRGENIAWARRNGADQVERAIDTPTCA